MTHERIADLMLHDSTLISVEMLWEQAVCRLRLEGWSSELSKPVPITLDFHGVSNLSVPKQEEWGPSVSILEVTQSAGVFFVQMQSGDLISISASGYNLATLQQFV